MSTSFAYAEPVLATVETTEEAAARLHASIAAGPETYAAVLGTLWADTVKVMVQPFGPDVTDETQFVDTVMGGETQFCTFIRRLVPDYDVVGTASTRPGDQIVMDITWTGTLPDGWSLHMHSTFICAMKDGRIYRYLVKIDPEETQRFVGGLGNPYGGSGVAAMEVGNS
jgi:SnoaL-like protein